MGFKQNQITWVTTTTGFDSTNYNRHRNLFRLVFFEQRSHGEDKKKISYQRDHLYETKLCSNKKKQLYISYELVIAIITNKS